MTARRRKEMREASLLEQEQAATARLNRVSGRGKVEASFYPMRDDRPHNTAQIKRRFWTPDELPDEPSA